MLDKLDDTTSAESISSVEDFHVNRYPAPESERESKLEHSPVSGSNSPESSGNLSQDSLSSKTSPVALNDGCPRCGRTCTCLVIERAPWGLAPQTSAHPTSESGCSLLPTPTAQSYGSNRGGANGRTGKVRHSLQTMAAQNLWPTPTVNGNYNRKGASKTSGDGLATAVRNWPTPRASPAENRQYKPSPSQLAGTHGKSLAAEVGGPLNPTWVEWLMGFPLEWTALKP